MLDPTEILSRRRTRPGPPGWITTYTGRRFNALAPDPESICYQDFAYGLSHKFRYGGQSDPAMTVAEHSVLVSQIVKRLWPEAHLMRAGLLHDVAEGYTVDIPSPVRKHTFVMPPGEGSLLQWNELEGRILNLVGLMYGLPLGVFDTPEVRAADMLALCIEYRDMTNLKGPDYGLPDVPEEIESLRAAFYDPATARRYFIAYGAELGLWQP